VAKWRETPTTPLPEAIVKAALERAAEIAQAKHDAAIKWAEVYVPTHKGPTDSSLIADDIRALASDPAEVAAIIKKAGETDETKR
jgi:hypothetical protein